MKTKSFKLRVFIGVLILLPSIFLPINNAVAARCLTIKNWYPTEILNGNQSGTGKLTFVSAAAVKSSDFDNVYFVAVKFKATGVGNQIGVWAVNGKLPQTAGDLQGLTLAINPIAQQFTVWPKGNKTSAKIAVNDRSVADAIKCLNK
jgi:hypothetical protein